MQDACSCCLQVSKEEEKLQKARLEVRRGLPLQDLSGNKGFPGSPPQVQSLGHCDVANHSISPTSAVRHHALEAHADADLALRLCCREHHGSRQHRCHRRIPGTGPGRTRAKHLHRCRSLRSSKEWGASSSPGDPRGKICFSQMQGLKLLHKERCRGEG